MRHTFLLIFCFLLSFGTRAQTGVQFLDTSWDEALAMAQSRDKLIFVDAYTTWCGPCKLMTRNVFPQPEVGNFYNTNFINLKIDMEKGKGLELASQYEVTAYPTLLFVDHTGTLVHRVAGYQSAEDMIGLGKTALDPERRLSGMEARYNNGERNPEFLYDYVIARYQAMDNSHQSVAKTYFSKQPDWSTPKNMQLLFLTVEDTDSEMFDFMLENRSTFEEMFGEQTVVAKIQQMILQKVYSSNSDLPALAEIDALYEKAYPEMAPRLSAFFRMNYYKSAGDIEKYADAATSYLEQFPSEDPNELNNIAWSFYESVEDDDMLRQAVEWAEKSVALDSQYYNNDTLAALYFKLGKKRKALKTAATAISIAKANGEDYSSTMELLEKMKS